MARNVDVPGGMRRHAACSLAAVALCLAAALVPEPARGQASRVGQWRTLPYTTPINPIHVALLRTGKVLIAAGSENDSTHTTFRAAVYDPRAGAFALQTVPWDLFCNAMSQLPDGRILVTGGNAQYNPFRGLRTTTIFDPATSEFIQVQDMAHGRWYPSNAALADGRTMTFSGWLETAGVPNTAVEIYSVPTGWSPEFRAPFTPPLYPWLHLLPNGKVFLSGSHPGSRIFDPATRTWSAVVASTRYGQDRRYGSSVLLPLRPAEGHRPRVMVMGGHDPATASAEVIDLSVPTPAWRLLPPMSAPRIEMNAVILPTGHVLALGGSAVDKDASTASLDADLFDPVTETWSPAGRAAFPRLYHSVALLLPDATVWVAGSNPFQGTWENRMEIYSPPYLFTTDASGRTIPAPRPGIAAAPARVGYNTSFTVSTPDAARIAQAVLVRPGSATHAFDFEQRLVELRFTAGSGALTVTSPPGSSIAPPGYYMLFLIDRSGVPSVARFVQLARDPANQPPQGTIANPTADVRVTAGQSVTFAGDAVDPDGSVTTFSWVFPGGTPATSTAPIPGAVTFSRPGTYVVSLTVTDTLGENDPSPPTRTVVVDPAAFTASFTSPPAGATVNGTQTVGMSVTGGGTAPFTYALQVDAAQVFSATSSSTTAAYAWNTAAVTDGSHTLTLTVRDSAGRVSTAARTVTVANAAGGIKVALTTPTPGQTVSGVTWVNVWVSGASGPFSYTLTAAGATVWTQSSTASHVTLPWDTTKTPSGTQALTATVRTSASTGSASVTVTVQNGPSAPAPLTAAFTSPGSGATVSGTVAVGLSAGGGKPDYSFTLRIDGRAVLGQSGPGTTASYAWNTTTETDGAHTLSLTVTDAAGATATATRGVTVANGGGGGGGTLGIALTTPKPGATVSGVVWVNVWVEAPYGRAPYSYVLSDGAATVASQSSSATHVTLAWDTRRSPNGSTTLTARVTDSGGAAGARSVTVTVANGTAGGGGLGVALTSPPPGGSVSGTVWANVWVTTPAGTAPYTYTLSAAGATVWTEASSAAHVALPWETTRTPSGPQTLTATVRDATGSTGTASVSVVVQNP